jgi:hypothetical protein
MTSGFVVAAIAMLVCLVPAGVVMARRCRRPSRPPSWWFSR